MNTSYNSTPAQWVASFTMSNGTTLDVSAKGAVAIDGNKFRPVYWESLWAVGSDEVRAILSRPELAPYCVRKQDKRAEFEAARMAHYTGLGLTEAQAKVLTSQDIKAARAAKLF